MMKGYLKKGLVVVMENDGNDYILGRISGIICAGKIGSNSYAMRLDKFKNQIYLTAYVFPWDYKRIKKVIEDNYPGKCKFFY